MKFIRKFIWKIIIFAVLTVALVAAIVFGVRAYVLSEYGIDIFRTASELAVLGEPVDESQLITEPFSDADMVNVQQIVNRSVENMIEYTKENGYSVNFDGLPDEMKYVITLTDRQIGALAQTVIEQELDSKLEMRDSYVGIALRQVDFFEKDGEIYINTVLTVDVTPLKDRMSHDFILKYFHNYVPNTLYISSTVKVIEGEGFDYAVIHDSMTVNNLTPAETADLFHTLDVLLEIGSDESLNLQIGGAVMDSLVGREGARGIAYSLRDIGATGYSFVFGSDSDFFAVER